MKSSKHSRIGGPGKPKPPAKRELSGSPSGSVTYGYQPSQYPRQPSEDYLSAMGQGRRSAHVSRANAYCVTGCYVLVLVAMLAVVVAWLWGMGVILSPLFGR